MQCARARVCVQSSLGWRLVRLQRTGWQAPHHTTHEKSTAHTSGRALKRRARGCLLVIFVIEFTDYGAFICDRVCAHTLVPMRAPMWSGSLIVYVRGERDCECISLVLATANIVHTHTHIGLEFEARVFWFGVVCWSSCVVWPLHS